MSKKIRMLLSNWTWQDAQDFFATFRDNNLEESYRLAQQLIASWDYEANLSNPDAFLMLSVPESSEILKTVYEQVNEYAETIDTSDVVVDLSKWTTKRFLEFNRAQSENKTLRVEAMLREVATMPGVTDEPLTLEQGACLMKAVMDTYRKSITGKN